MLADDGLLTTATPAASSFDRRPPDDPGAARRAPRPPGRRPSAPSSRPRRSRARSSRASASPRWWATGRRSIGAHLRGWSARTSSGPSGADGNVPLPPPAHPRRRLRRHAEGAAGRAARALRGLAAGAPAPPGIDELLGYHLERAVVLRRELGETEDATADLAARASAHLGAAGLRAAQRDDPSAASALLERAMALRAPDDDARGALLPPLGASLFEAGRLAEAVARPRRGDRPRAGTARLHRPRPNRARVRPPGAETERRDRARPGRRRRGPPGARARGRPPRPVPRLVPARPGGVDRGSRHRADAAWGEAAVCARLAGDERELFGDPRLARDRGRARTHAGRRGDPPLRGLPRARRRQPGGGRADGQPACVVARDARAISSSPTASCARPTRRSTSSAASVGVSHHRGAGAAARGPARPGRAAAARRLDALASMSDRRLLATTRAMLAQAVYAQGHIERGRAAVRGRRRRRRPRRHRHPGDLAGVKAKILAGRGPLRRGRGARPRRGRARRADRLALPPRRCDARPRRGTAVEFPHRCVSRRG